jgi:hypothetical protein
MLACLAVVLEMAQQWVPGRHFQIIDFAASSAAACFGMLAVAAVDRFGPTYFGSLICGLGLFQFSIDCRCGRAVAGSEGDFCKLARSLYDPPPIPSNS